MNKTMKMTLIALCGALISPAVMAQTALSALKLQAGDEAVAASARVEAVHGAVLDGGRIVTLPAVAKDVFAQCQAVDAKAMSLVAWTLPQAVGAMQNCLDKTYNQHPFARRIYFVTAKAGRFGVPMCPSAPGMMSCQGIMEVQGIVITVSGKILTGDSVLMDLNYSLKKRSGLLLGWHTSLDNQAVILH
ncbi:MAG: hypothetical protein HY077_12110 [Elusimicrobia bacterium]|nr:hypothetical protein [Elusimicrobiota bacterium]